MSNEINILDEFQVEKVDKTKSYSLLLGLMGAYFLLFFINIFFDFYSKSLRPVKFFWVPILIGLVLPGIGFVLLILRSKVGWAISMLYFSFFASLVLVNYTHDLMQNKEYIWLYPNTIRLALFFLISFLISVVLFSKSIRSLYKVKKWVLIITISFSLFLVLIISLFR